MNLRKIRYLLLAYVAFDFFIGGYCGGFLPLTPMAAAQFTQVTGTVTDPNGLPYAFGTISALLVTSGSPTLNGFAYTPPTQPTGLASNGSFTMQLADNTQLQPAATKWNFTVCSAAGTIQPAGGKGPVCFSLAAPITISGASQSISANLNAVAPLLSSVGNISGSLANTQVAFGSATNTIQGSASFTFDGTNLSAPVFLAGDGTCGGNAGIAFTNSVTTGFCRGGSNRLIGQSGSTRITSQNGNDGFGILNGYGLYLTVQPDGTSPKPLFTNTAPTISSGFGTSPSITFQNGSAAFRINVGTGGVASSGVIGITATSAVNGWNCQVNNLTAAAANRADNTVQTASAATTVTVQNQTKSTGAAVAWTASDIVTLDCFAF